MSGSARRSRRPSMSCGVHSARGNAGAGKSPDSDEEKEKKMIRSKFKPVLTLSAAVLLLLATGALAQESQINIQSNRGLRARPEGPADAWQNEPMGPTSSFSASAVPICTLPLSSLVAHVPQIPCRQPDGINTPFLSELSNKVSSGETSKAKAERDKPLWIRGTSWGVRAIN